MGVVIEDLSVVGGESVEGVNEVVFSELFVGWACGKVGVLFIWLMW